MPFDGEIVEASDGYPERSRIVPIRDIAIVIKNGLTFDPRRGLRHVLGNHVIARRDDGVLAAFAHLAPGSVAVGRGDAVRMNDLVGRVGHTGNSTAPHLHFQLMDAADPRTARGVPCAFRVYEIERGDRWELVSGGIPGRRDRIRAVGG
jgi:murein DD-endopeptidase MepM/ murein hydrolase activator NlpD